MKKVKKIKNIYDEDITIENLFYMWSIIKKTCKNKREIYYFSLNLNTNLYNIYKKLKTKTYIPSKYRTFVIFEPKPRLVMSQTITDKIVNHFVANYYLIPYLESTLIDSNVATRKNKGSSYAMGLLKKYFNKIIINNPNKEIYCLKMDISKYFYSIDHDILLNMVKKKIKDIDVIRLINIIISETNFDYINHTIDRYNNIYNIDIPHYEKGVGLSIGAMSSQFLAIYFLNDLDHYIKEELKCKYYIRYMDDLIILDINKEKLKNVYQKLSLEMENIKLKVNKKSNIYRSSKGFSFLGYVYKTINNKLYISCKKDNVIRIKKKLSYLERKDKLKYIKILASYNGYFKPVYEIERGKYKMISNSRKIYDNYKIKYCKSIIIVKEGIFYKTYLDDAKIMWYLFSYKYSNDVVSFRNNSYDNVILILKQSNISFVIVDKEKELLSYFNDELFYDSYFNLSSKSYEKYQREDNIINDIKSIIESYPDSCDIIEEFLSSLKKKMNIELKSVE